MIINIIITADRATTLLLELLPRSPSLTLTLTLTLRPLRLLYNDKLTTILFRPNGHLSRSPSLLLNAIINCCHAFPPTCSVFLDPLLISPARFGGTGGQGDGKSVKIPPIHDRDLVSLARGPGDVLGRKGRTEGQDQAGKGRQHRHHH